MHLQGLNKEKDSPGTRVINPNKLVGSPYPQGHPNTHINEMQEDN